MNSLFERHRRPTSRHVFVSIALTAVAVLGSQPGCGSGKKESCDGLEQTAHSDFEAFATQYESCTVDDDCTSVAFTESSTCASPCPTILNQAGAASAIATATQACSEFNAQGCSPPSISCPLAGNLICAAGTCTAYGLELTSSGAVTHGACTAFHETYVEPFAPAPAPRDFSLAVTVSNGTLYADSACTTPLTSGTVTLAQGSSSVAFGFVPTVAGEFSVTINGVEGETGIAQ